MWKYIVIATLFLGCGGTQSKKASNQTDREEIDLNGDGTPDAWKTYLRKDGKLIVIKKEMDLNFDGVVDVTRDYNEDGVSTQDTMDMDFDKKPDAWTYYKDGKLDRKELDLGNDGKPDQVKTYVDGKLAQVSWDSDGDGRNDYFERYKDGKLHEKGRDTDKDGKPDPEKWVPISEDGEENEE